MIKAFVEGYALSANLSLQVEALLLRKDVSMGTKIVTTDDMQARLSELLISISNGDDVIIKKNNKPFAKIMAISDTRKKRVPGLNKGEIWTSEDFDTPLPDEFWLGEE